jgi:hypothetical protein
LQNKEKIKSSTEVLSVWKRNKVSRGLEKENDFTLILNDEKVNYRE